MFLQFIQCRLQQASLALLDLREATVPQVINCLKWLNLVHQMHMPVALAWFIILYSSLVVRSTIYTSYIQKVWKKSFKLNEVLWSIWQSRMCVFTQAQLWCTCHVEGKLILLSCIYEKWSVGMCTPIRIVHISYTGRISLHCRHRWLLQQQLLGEWKLQWSSKWILLLLQWWLLWDHLRNR